MDEEFLRQFTKYRDFKNCELSERDTRDLDAHTNTIFEYGNYNFYERNNFRGMLDNEAECLDGTC